MGRIATQMSRPTVLVIGPSPPPYNGMSVATELLMKAIAGKITYVHLDTADRRGLSNIGRVDVVNVVLAGYHALKYLRLLVVERPEIVYVPISQNRLGFLRDCLFLIPARLLGKKVVIHLHGGYFDRFYKTALPFMRAIIRFALRSTARAIVLGQSLSGIFEGIIPRERVRVVPNGLEDKFGSWRNRTRNSHRPMMLFLSTLMEEKGILAVLRAVPAVKERVPDVRVVFAGEWFRRSDRERAEQLVRDLNLESQVEFVGAVAAPLKYELLKSADIFVFPTAYAFEGHPFVILEAMSAGIPIISTKWACIPETVRDGVEGFLLDSGDIEALAERMAQLLRDETLRRRMGLASRERFLAQYTIDRFAGRVRGVFEEVLDGKQPLCEPEIV